MAAVDVLAGLEVELVGFRGGQELAEPEDLIARSCAHGGTPREHALAGHEGAVRGAREQGDQEEADQDAAGAERARQVGACGEDGDGGHRERPPTTHRATAARTGVGRRVAPQRGVRGCRKDIDQLLPVAPVQGLGPRDRPANRLVAAAGGVAERFDFERASVEEELDAGVGTDEVLAGGPGLAPGQGEPEAGAPTGEHPVHGLLDGHRSVGMDSRRGVDGAHLGLHRQGRFEPWFGAGHAPGGQCGGDGDRVSDGCLGAAQGGDPVGEGGGAVAVPDVAVGPGDALGRADRGGEPLDGGHVLAGDIPVQFGDPVEGAQRTGDLVADPIGLGAAAHRLVRVADPDRVARDTAGRDDLERPVGRGAGRTGGVDPRDVVHDAEGGIGVPGLPGRDGHDDAVASVAAEHPVVVLDDVDRPVGVDRVFGVEIPDDVGTLRRPRAAREPPQRRQPGEQPGDQPVTRGAHPATLTGPPGAVPSGAADP